MDLAKLALDDEWLRQLEEVARATTLDLAPKRLAVELRALSDAYNSGDFARSRNRGALAARLAFSFPRDVPKMACAARELVWSGRLAVPESRALSVLDFGAGLGASTWGLARLLGLGGARGRIEATFVDVDDEALRVARAISSARKSEGEVDVRVATENRRTAPFGQYDVILVGQSLGEMSSVESEQAAMLEELVARHLDEHGALVVVEPALAERTRRLQRVRDALAARGITVFSPCLHAAACPMLAEPKSWCHEDLDLDLPAPVAAIARAAALRWQGLTFSYLVLRKDGFTLSRALDESARGAMRVVSLPIVTKGKRELHLCGPADDRNARVRKIARLDRDEPNHVPRNAAERGWSNAARGDVLVFSPQLPDDAARVPREISVRRVPTS